MYLLSTITAFAALTTAAEQYIQPFSNWNCIDNSAIRGKLGYWEYHGNCVTFPKFARSIAMEKQPSSASDITCTAYKWTGCQPAGGYREFVLTGNEPQHSCKNPNFNPEGFRSIRCY
jgi:hypothetical protein